jgi:hypothetical protein
MGLPIYQGHEVQMNDLLYKRFGKQTIFLTNNNGWRKTSGESCNRCVKGLTKDDETQVKDLK